MDTLTHAHVLIGRTQKQRLRVLAADRRASMAALVRDAIDHYLRVVAGPPPKMVRMAARAAAGALPLDPPATEPRWGADDDPGFPVG
jgi:hypothetical protein